MSENLPALVLAAPVCPECRGPVGEPRSACGRCSSPYHPGCFGGACVVRGCEPPALPAVQTTPDATASSKLFMASLFVFVVSASTGVSAIAIGSCCTLALGGWQTYRSITAWLERAPAKSRAPGGTEALHWLSTAVFVGTPLVLAFGLGVLIAAISVVTAIVHTVRGLFTDRDPGRALTAAGLMATVVLILRLLAR